VAIKERWGPVKYLKINSKVLLSFLILACFFVFNINTEAAVDTVPHQISYQGKLTDTQGVPVNGPVDMVFTIVDSSDNALWSNSLSVTVTNGHFSTSLGSESSIPATIFQNSNLRLNISINGESFMSPINLLASPYAFNAELLDGVDSDQFLRSDEDDTMTGNLNLDGNFVLTGTATVQNKLLVKVNDATKDWALSVLREEPTLIVNMDKESELNDGLGSRGYVIIPQNCHEKVKNNVEYYLEKAGLITKTTKFKNQTRRR